MLPINVSNRNDASTLKLSSIGNYGLVRKPREKVPSHLHTGIDIKRPNNDYSNEPIFPIAAGRVISIRSDGPYAQIIIEHKNWGKPFWTVYEHISGIDVKINEIVTPQKPIARFMNTNELNKYGWQFDHFHLEILRIKPNSIKPTRENSMRYYNSYTLVCFTNNDLIKYYYNPIEFLNEFLKTSK